MGLAWSWASERGPEIKDLRDVNDETIRDVQPTHLTQVIMGLAWAWGSDEEGEESEGSGETIDATGEKPEVLPPFSSYVLPPFSS